ncbi:unnamed protein product [Vitrella brassicaformis CCMP3155]|uniref:BTB domain-containing protein n=2 Tax=Vitrella brassicaformis TaxID=1169539 RepID=A0A0G4F3X6_VITBC|nr:unnamed protein product [Vitrella brassicaformis CCMP3155]|mmetsp:Transcript_19863/g.56983  ORF Transcript_19863/g.56983 Transcript_19863/m.56983 type:complete len:282 (+) Transcript_19863:26-871(+)|eukprot:CEM06410.1 unnamed protein product [Vitrella brassicaformis CCMP3155]
MMLVSLPVLLVLVPTVLADTSQAKCDSDGDKCVNPMAGSSFESQKDDQMGKIKGEVGSIVRLNVAGTEFQVANATLARRPHTRLGQFVTNEGTAEYQLIRADRPVFIDADPHLFPLVLEYHRHGTPILTDGSVDVRKVVRELRLFGIEDVTEEAIQPTKEAVMQRKDEMVDRVGRKVAQLLLPKLVDQHQQLEAAKKDQADKEMSIKPYDLKKLLDAACKCLDVPMAAIAAYRKQLKSDKDELDAFVSVVHTEMMKMLPPTGPWPILKPHTEGGSFQLAVM